MLWFIQTAIQNYMRVDLSETGLNLATQNLNRLNCSVELKQQEMREFLDDRGNQEVRKALALSKKIN